MRRQANAPSAGSNQRQGRGLLADRRVRAMTAAAFATATVLLAVALAQAGKGVSTFIGVQGSTGNAAGQFNNQRGVDVNHPDPGGPNEEDSLDPYGNSTDGYLYVADDNNHRVQVFDDEGEFVFSFGGEVNATETANICPRPGFPADDCAKAGNANVATAGFLDNPKGVAIDQSTGDVYVTDEDNRRVQKFSAAGEFLLMFGDGVNAGTGDPDVCTGAGAPTDECTEGASVETGAEASFNDSLMDGIGVDPNGAHDVYVADPNYDRVQVFDSAGNFLRMFGYGVQDGSAAAQVCTTGCQAGSSGNGDGQLNEPRDVAIDDAGNAYVVEPDGNRVQRFAGGGVAPLAENAEEFAPAELGGDPEPIRVEVDTGAAAGNGDDSVYVVKPDPSSGPDGGDSAEVKQLDTSGALQDVHGDDSGIPMSNSSGGLTLNPASGLIYLSTDSFGHEVVYVLEDVAAPVAQVDPPTELAGVTATLNGKVNPTGHPTSYHFEYKESADPDFPWFWISEPAPPGDAGSGNTLTAVPPEPIEFLKPETSYDVRLVATKPFNAGSDVSETISFFTAPAPVDVSDEVTAHQDGAGRVRLVGRVNPGFGETEYRFEYGPDTGYGSQTPTASILSDPHDLPERVTAVVDGLDHGTTYHFRLVAENAAGEDESADGVFELGNQASLDNRERVYEMVSPPDKNGQGAEASIELFGIGRGNAIGRDGDAASWYSNQSFANVEYGAGQFQAGYISFRGDDGWRTEGIQPFQDVTGSQPVGLMQDHFWSADLRRMIFRGGGFPTPQTTHNNGDTHFRNPGGHMSWLYQQSSIDFPGPTWGTPSLDRFTTSTNIVLSDETGIPDDTVGKVYEWSQDRAANNGFKLASIMPDGSPATANARAGSAKQEESVHRTMSLDGNHVFFSTPSPTAFTPPEPPDSAKIYRRSFGSTTTMVSPSKLAGGDPQGEKAKLYWTSTPDQSASGPAAVFFTSAEQLTDDANTGPTRAGSELYRYEINTDELTAISAETNTTDGARVKGVIDVSDDGNWVYYVGLGQVVAGEGVEGQQNLYGWHDDGSADGTTKFIATLDGGSECSASAEPDDDACNYHHGEGQGPLPGKYGHERTGRVSRDGRRVVFQSREQLTGYDNFGPECAKLSNGDLVPGNCQQVFLYEFDGGAGDGQLTCITCPATGAPAQEQMTPPTSPPGRTPVGDPARYVSDDGRRIFFVSKAPYVPKDDNGFEDLYEWEDGEYSLISTGRANHDTDWIGASSSGDDVFFATREQLDPYGNDFDGVGDVYDARVGGGFGPLELPPLQCTGEDCKPVATPQPDYPLPATSGVVGRGNVRDDAQRNCGRHARLAKRLSVRAKRLRRNARRVDGRKRTASLQRRSKRFAKSAKRKSSRAKRCKRRNQRSGR